MQIIDNKALLLKVRDPLRITNVIPKSHMVDDHQVLVRWGLEEVQVLKNLGIKNLPSPISKNYDWPGLFKPFHHQRITAEFLTLHRRAFCFNEQGCVDADTEYLSPLGWRRIADYTGGEVAQWEGGAITFVNPLEYVKLPCQQMIKIKTKYGLDQMLSPEHRVLLEDGKRATTKREVISAAELLRRHDAYHNGTRAKVGGTKSGTNTIAFTAATIPTTFLGGSKGLSWDDATLRVMVAVIADGYFGSNTNHCVVRLKKERKKLRLRQLLTDAGIPYKERAVKPTGFSMFVFAAPRRVKEFDAPFWEASSAQLAIIAEECLLWDGCTTRGARFSTTSKLSADFIQYAFSATKRTARVITQNRNDGRKTEYTVQIRDNTRLFIRSSRCTVTTTPSTDGYKYCFMVPSTFLVFRRNGCVFVSGNTGKTASVIWAADYLMKQGFIRRVLVLCPLSIMGSAWQQDLFRFAMHRSVTIAHHRNAKRRKELIREDTDFVVMNYDGVDIVKDEILTDERFDLIVVDECFVAGTLVSTPQGRRPIEQLEAGDKVLTSDRVMRINKLVRKTTTQLVEVNLGNGKTIRCTPEHPFFTDAGWVCAKNLTGRRLVSGVELSCLRAGISPRAFPGAVGYGEQPTPWADLLKILRTEEVALSEPQQERLLQLAARATGEAVRTEDSGTPRKAVGNSENQRAQASSTRRERYWDDKNGATDFRGFACGVGMELPGSVGPEAARLSYELQARLRMAATQGGARSGREQSHGSSATGAGSQKGSEAGGAWVVSVSHIECPNGEAVYNLEVEGTPNYFVGDHWLVHNCNAYKTVSTNRWKTFNKLIRPDTWLWMLTGTPASQSPEDAYGLARLVNPTGVPKFFGAFRDMVMNKVTQFKWSPKPNAIETVHRVLQPAIRFTKEQCLDLPDMMYVMRDVPLSKQQQKYYDIMRTQMLVEAAGEAISAVNAAAKLTKLLQISAGAVYSDTDEIVDFDCKDRMNVLKEVIDEASHKVLVFAPFRHSIYAIAEELKKSGYTLDVIDGGVPPGKRTEIFSKFQTERDPRILVIQPQAASHGVTLHAADTVVWWSPVTSVETYLQACARVHRAGQKNNVTVVHLQSSPVERRMYKMLSGKVDVHEKLVDLYREEMKDERTES